MAAAHILLHSNAAATAVYAIALSACHVAFNQNRGLVLTVHGAMNLTCVRNISIYRNLGAVAFGVYAMSCAGGIFMHRHLRAIDGVNTHAGGGTGCIRIGSGSICQGNSAIVCIYSVELASGIQSAVAGKRHGSISHLEPFIRSCINREVITV